MSDINSIHITGHLGQDPEVRNTAGGKRVANITVATTFRENTQWHRCVLWGTNADYAEKYLSKGSHIYLEGRMEYRDWVDKEGHKRTSAEISANTVQGLDKRDRGSTGHTEAPKDHVEVNGNSLEDLPF